MTPRSNRIRPQLSLRSPRPRRRKRVGMSGSKSSVSLAVLIARRPPRQLSLASHSRLASVAFRTLFSSPVHATVSCHIVASSFCTHTFARPHPHRRLYIIAWARSDQSRAIVIAHCLAWRHRVSLHTLSHPCECTPHGQTRLAVLAVHAHVRGPGVLCRSGRQRRVENV
jgi:hypothetical protein